jgi:hypothetical protein
VRIAVLLLALLPLMTGPAPASAQAVYYRSIPIGERAIGLGGAYTGIADDPSAAYYNPAGITSGGRFQLLGSLSSLVFVKSKVNGGFQLEDEAKTFKSDSTTTLPRFVGTVVKFGRVKYGDHQFSVAYSSFEPQRNSESFSDVGVTEQGSVGIRIGNGFRSRWYGASFAGRLSEKMSLGTTAYVAAQRLGYDEFITLSEGGTMSGVQVSNPDFAVTTYTDVSAKSYHLALRLGYLFLINPKWQWGVMFQAPGIPLRQRGSIFRQGSEVQGSEVTYLTPIDESSLQASMPIPFELRTGAAHRINQQTLLSVDFSVDGPVSGGRVVQLPSELTDVEARPGIYYANSTKRRWAPNTAIGAEHKFGKAIVAGGLFTNISAAADVPESSASYAAAQVNLYGGSIYVGLDTKGYKLSFGATGEYGRGHALAVSVDRFGNAIRYERTAANSGALILFVAGAVSVASKAAKDIKERHEEKKAAVEAASLEARTAHYPEEPAVSSSPADSSRARSGLPSARSR